MPDAAASPSGNKVGCARTAGIQQTGIVRGGGIAYGAAMNWSARPFPHLTLLIVLAALAAQAHEPVTRARSPIRLPDIPGYRTLKCDFHIHTVFSDGLVWPTVRAEEAWREGLDAIAITDHIEYQPHKADVSTNHNRAYEIARGLGNDLNTLVIQGSEITRGMPPGHLNAIFLTNATLLATERWQDAVRAARDQGAYIFWNHPGWERQLTDGQIKWYPEHTELVEQDLLHGIEVVNGRDYYPEAHRWAIEKKLTLFSNSDVHQPIHLDYHLHAADHRPLTLVFARERSLDAIKEALFDRRTAVYSGGRLLGDERFVRPLFDGSVRILNPGVTLRGRGRVLVQIHNDSDVSFVLERGDEPEDLIVPRKLTLAGQKTVLLELRPRGTPAAGTRSFALPFQVTNILTAPGEPLPITLNVQVTFAR